MPKAIYICSLSHSGSTVLSLLLSAHPQITSLGEIEDTVARSRVKQKRCTCGREVEECTFWGDLIADTPTENSEKSYRSFYEKLLAAFVNMDGVDSKRILCDSSKTLTGLRTWQRINDVELKVIFLVKDVRGYLFSQRRRGREEIKKKKDGIKRFVSNSTPSLGWRWFNGNRKLHSYLVNNRLAYFQIGYEELVFRPRESLEALSSFVGVDFDERMVNPGNASSHILRGNRMRFETGRLHGLEYDYRWLRSKWWLNSSTLPFLGANRRLVYSNEWN